MRISFCSVIIFTVVTTWLPRSEQHSISLKRGQAGLVNPKMRYKIPPPVSGEIFPPRFVELLVVVHRDTSRYHGDGTMQYIASVLNQAAGLWSEVGSLGVNVTLGITKTIILDADENLPIMADATQLLRTFCRWQQVQDDSYLGKFDVAVLITRENIHINNNYNATGLAYMMGACDGDYRCAVVEDKSPMDTAMTAAHELAHLLGVFHDGQFNACPDRLNLMSGYTVSGPESARWSTCSTESLLKYLRLPRAHCLKNVPLLGSVHLLNPRSRPGQTYTGDDQCRIAFGSGARVCQTKRESMICLHLKCLFPDKPQCIPTNRPALDGTPCGASKWCYRGYCVTRPAGYHRDDLGPVVMETTTSFTGDTPATRSTSPRMRTARQTGIL